MKPNIRNIDETIDTLIKNRYSVARFGDGELGIINERSINFQESNILLANRLKEIIKSKDNQIMICIPRALIDTSIYNKEAKYFWDEHLKIGRMAWYKVIDLKKIYFDTKFTRLYMDYKDKDKSKEWFERIKKVWSNKDIVIVEGDKSRLGVGNDLFDECKSIKRVLAPSKNAFYQYSNILDYILKNVDNDKMILIALGPTATVLAYDLSRYGYQAIDIGHIDIEYEWFLKKSNKKVAIRNKFVNEVDNGSILEEFYNQEYIQQIIKTI